ncbi:MAG: class I SAM-dependent methyltransferase [Roseiflexaceae bacterium]|nr:class I SAM-dependent methyltransferase [Roseiflexaceae bacterium]
MSDELFDFAAVWAAGMQRRPDARLDPAVDRAFWQQYAECYDERAGDASAIAQTLALIRDLVHPNDTLLDIGAGTGRFTLPLAQRVRHVTALDQSAAMLAVLRRKAHACGVTNITFLEVDWQDATVVPHDVVLAAWSIYRLIDLRAALEKMVAAARRALVIIGGVGGSPPHRPLIEAICGTWTESPYPSHLLIAGTLWQMGLAAEVRITRETRAFAGATPRDIAQTLAPDASPDALDALEKGLLPLLHRHEDGWRYAYPQPVGVVVWRVGHALQ